MQWIWASGCDYSSHRSCLHSWLEWSLHWESVQWWPHFHMPDEKPGEGKRSYHHSHAWALGLSGGKYLKCVAQIFHVVLIVLQIFQASGNGLCLFFLYRKWLNRKLLCDRSSKHTGITVSRSFREKLGFPADGWWCEVPASSSSGEASSFLKQHGGKLRSSIVLLYTAKPISWH